VQEDVVDRIHNRLARKSQRETTDADGQVDIPLGGTSLGKPDQLFGAFSDDDVAIMACWILVGNLQENKAITYTGS
jgi:hypothetical protein